MTCAAISRGSALRALLVTLTMAAGVDCDAVRAAQYDCAGSRALVNTASATDAQLACLGAIDAIAFLARLGLETPASIPIDVVPQLVDGVRPTMVGFYRESDGRVQILNYGEFSKRRTWFNLPINRTLYRALVTHEVAHAVAARNFKVPSPSIQAKEYIAYVTMLSTMPADAREKILSQFPGQAFEGDWQMGSAIYLADPMRFGVRAYRHFAALGYPRAYLQDILAGRVLGGG